MNSLQGLLTIIRSGGTFETGELAERLNTTPEMVTAMLEHLQRAGYLQHYQNQNKCCQGCDHQMDCEITCQQAGLKVWQEQNPLE